MLKRLFNIKRYFIVSYSFKSGSGYTEVHVTKGNFFNKHIFSKDIMAKLESLKDPNMVVGNIVVTGILEVNRRDYNDFIRNEKPESSRKVSDM